MAVTSPNINLQQIAGFGGNKSPFKMNNPKGVAVGSGNYSQYFAQIKKETKQT